MTIIRPNSISGINSITAKNTDQMKLYDSNGAWSHVRAGVVTATSFSGSITGSTGTFGGDVTISGDLGVAGTLTYEDVARVDAIGLSTYREGLHIGPLAGIGLTAYKDGSIRTSGIITAKTYGSPMTVQDSTGGISTTKTITSEFIRQDGTRNPRIQIKHNEEGSIIHHTYSTAASNLMIDIGNAEQLRITQNGKVGIGITNPTGQFAVSDGTRIAEINPHSNGTYIGNRSNHPVLFQVNASEKMKIDTNGDIIIGATSWSYPKPLNVQGSSGAILALSNYDTTSYAQDTMTSIEFRLNTGNTNNQNGACEIRAIKENGTNGDNARSLSFWTGTNGGSPSEKFRIYGSGESHHQGQKHTFRYDNGGGLGPYLSLQNKGSNAAGTKTGIAFGCDTSDAQLGGGDWANGEIEVRNEGSNNAGIMEFRVHDGSNNFPAMKIHGNGANVQSTNSVSHAFKGGVAFGCAGVAIDKSWDNYPGMNVLHTTAHSDTNQGQFRFHGWNRNFAAYPAATGSDFGVTVVADGMTITSDQRRKTGITTITDALDTVSKLRGVSFTMINRDLTPQTHMSMADGKKLGFIAQEVMPILPAAIMDSGDHVQPLENGYCDRYMMDYGAITPVLVEAIKELTAKVDTLQNEVRDLNIEVTALKSS